MLDAKKLDQALDALSQVLQRRGLSYELVATGGSALLLLGLIERTTRDVDIVALVQAGLYIRADPLPVDLTDAVHDVGISLDLGDDWLNAGPASLLDFGLPAGFASRVDTRRYGPLTLHLASREDQICFKVYAATDQGPQSRHYHDLKALSPTETELITAALWAVTHDPSDGFRLELKGLLRSMGVKDATLHI